MIFEYSLEDLFGVVVSEMNDKEVVMEFILWKDCYFLFKNWDDFVVILVDVMGMEKGFIFSICLELYYFCMFLE